jgi:hypothetical protein
MKSFRLKRRKNTKRRKGGNGKQGSSSSSSSSEVNFKDLKKLVIDIKIARGLLIEEAMEPGRYDQNKIEAFISNNANKILTIFNEDVINLSQLTMQETDQLLHLIAGIRENSDEHDKEIDNQIIEAYADAYIRYQDTDNSSLLTIEYLNNEIENTEELIKMIDSGEDDLYPHEDKDKTLEMYENNIENIKKIRDKFIAVKTNMVKNMSFLPKEKDPGPNAFSTHRGLLPDPEVDHVMSYLIPQFRNTAAKPTEHSTIISKALENIKTMSSRSKKGGRRSRKLRKSNRRK